MPPRLIITADDFGGSGGVNAAVAALYDAGAVTAASLMVGAPAAREAAELARARPGLAVGLHVTAVCGPALLPHADLPRITGPDGTLPRAAIPAGVRYTLDSAARRELSRELEAQFKAFDRLGLGWSHLDFHVHMGLTPAVFDAALGLAARYPIAGLRVPEDDHALYCRMDPGDAACQRRMAGWFRRLAARMRRRAAARGLRTTRWCYGFFRTGRLDGDYLALLVRHMPDADLELHCHPDLETPAGRAEFEALRSPAFRHALDERGVELCSFASLVGRG